MKNYNSNINFDINDGYFAYAQKRSLVFPFLYYFLSFSFYSEILFAFGLSS